VLGKPPEVGTGIVRRPRISESPGLGKVYGNPQKEKENPTKLVINKSMFYLFGGYYEPFKVSLLIGEWSCTS
jgi:hypothetical protein